MTFERLKPFLVLVLIGIFLIASKLYWDSQQTKVKIQDAKVKSSLACENYKDHFNSFIDGKAEFNSLNISIITAELNDLKCKDEIENLIHKCKQQQLVYLSGLCQHPHIESLINEFITCTTGSSFQKEAQEILDCIHYKKNHYQSDREDFIKDCKKTSLNIKWNSTIWNSKAKNSKLFNVLDGVSSCQCCAYLKTDLNNELIKWKSKHLYYHKQYDLLTKSYKQLVDDGPRERTIINRSAFQQALTSLPIGSYYHTLHINSSISFN